MSRLFRKTLLAIVLVFGVSANATALLSAWLLHRHLTDEYVTKGRAIAMAIAAASPDALVSGDAASVQAMIDEFLRIEGVGYVFVADRMGRIAAHTFLPAMPATVPQVTVSHQEAISIDDAVIPDRGDFIQVTAPILAGEAGQVSVGMDKAGIWRVMREAVIRQEVLMLAMFAVAVVIFYALVSSIARPLAALAEYAVKIRDHDFSATPPPASDDEVGVLARAMGSMASQLSLLVSNLKQAVADTTRELNDSLAHIQAIIDNLADGLLVVDDAGRATLHNPALLAMFGLTGTDPAGRWVRDAFPPAMAALAASCLHDKALPETEVTLHDGGTGKVVATSFRLPGQARTAVILLVRDVTVEKEVDRMKTEFISTVSHELRTPLTSVLGFAKIIRRKFLELVVPALPPGDARIARGTGQIRENLDIIVAEGERLTELVDDVLDIAKMESGRCEWDMEPISLAAVADHAVKAATPLAARKGLALTADIASDLPAVMADRDRLVQVLLNLIGNAVKFTTSGWVRLSAAAVDGEVRVAVADSGAGIAAKDLETIFEKFKQAGDTLTEKPKGTGLGLPICRQIVERHGGRIWAESVPGKGSVFRFTLPALAGPTAERICPMVVAPTTGGDESRVLVVDDDAAVRRYLETVLTEGGYEVATAHGGAEALKLAASWKPGCITMDLHMPGMDGREAIRRLRADPATRDIPVMVLTVASNRERAASGADAVLAKPVDEEALLAAVRNLLEGPGEDDARPCLVYAADGGRRLSRRFLLCPGEVTSVDQEDGLWQALEKGFCGTVFVPASRGHDLDLGRLSAYPGVCVIIIPD
ncbi:MAG: PAS domain S-box [Solidesulfovibrio magneticus str. Maddingley MBC34]|uniref:histidine kinase n=1 Tax=Solidesulfovibrio magneticus str. Maddingley MBC34 TaxID=1206767 RepID=K6HCZ2_9BACT|nr:MAG: PAS domain S-box [Solidesulfovibrio magneticus str. Maddingley MBC34]